MPVRADHWTRFSSPVGPSAGMGGGGETGAGRRVPQRFGDPRAEYEAVRRAAGLIDPSHQGKVRISGADGQDFLNRMLTNDIKALAAGRGCPSFLLNPKGHVVAYLSLL